MSKISSLELSGALWVASGFELILRMMEGSRLEELGNVKMRRIEPVEI